MNEFDLRDGHRARQRLREHFDEDELPGPALCAFLVLACVLGAVVIGLMAWAVATS